MRKIRGLWFPVMRPTICQLSSRWMFAVPDTQPDRQRFLAGARASLLASVDAKARGLVASKMALPMAAATGRIEASPAPDGGRSGRSSSTMSMVSGGHIQDRVADRSSSIRFAGTRGRDPIMVAIVGF